MGEQRERKAPGSGGQDVAQRFRYFLEQAGLTREQFVTETDGAVTARSLYAVLSGARRPSRALAVLIERTWGFRADFLLHGVGEMWVPASRRVSGRPSPAEEEVLAFMRRSVENAHVVRSEVERAELWERVFARTLRLMGELGRAAASDDPGARTSYPLFARLSLEECLFLADRYELLAELRHDQRVHELTDEFIRGFVDPALDDPGRARLAGVKARRRRAAAARREAIDELGRGLDQIGASDLPHRELLRRSASQRAVEHRGAIERLRGHVPEELLAALESTAPAAPDERARLVAYLAEALEPKPVPSGHAAEELEQLHREIIDRLAA